MLLQQLVQIFRNPARLFVQAGAGMKRFRFEDKRAGLVKNPIGEIHSNALDCGRPEFNRQDVIITSRGLVTHAAFNHWKNDFLLLPLQQRRADMAKEFTPCGFE